LLLPLVTSGAGGVQRMSTESLNNPHLLNSAVGAAGGPSGRHRLIGGTLIIASVVPEDVGRYVCSANNSMGLVESRTELVFRDKLHVRIIEFASAAQGQQQIHSHTGPTADQHVQVVDAETSVTITCLYSGSPR
jgi:hypothetical protein